jgi:ankyrin repeat protein
MKGTEYLLLQHRTNIDTADVGSALESAAEGGHIAIVDFLLQRCNDIAADDVGSALCYAAIGGHSRIVDILLQSRADIAAADVSYAFEIAAEDGRISTVDMIFQRRFDFDRVLYSNSDSDIGYDNVFDEEDRKRGRKLRSDDSDSLNPKKDRH